MDYSTLKSLVQSYCESDETTFVDNIPNFVYAAEERIYNSVQLPAIRQNKRGQLTTGTPYLTLPDDWLATFSLSVLSQGTNVQNFLLNKDVDYIRESFPDPAYTAMPTHYAQFDKNTLIVGPTPDVDYLVELHYYYYPESIVTAGSSWLGDNFETVLLYGVLREAYLFQKGEADITKEYEGKYQEALMLLKQLGDGKNRRDAYRSGQVRVPIA